MAESHMPTYYASNNMDVLTLDVDVCRFRHGFSVVLSILTIVTSK